MEVWVPRMSVKFEEGMTHGVSVGHVRREIGCVVDAEDGPSCVVDVRKVFCGRPGLIHPPYLT